MNDRSRLAKIRELAVAGAAGSPLTRDNAMRDIAALVAALCDPDEVEECAPSLVERLGGDRPPLPGYMVAAVQAASRLLNFSNIQPIPAQVGLVPGESNPYRMIFQAGSGWVIGMRGSVIGKDPLWRSSIGVKLELNTDPITTDGERAVFTPFSDLFSEAQVYCPLRRFLTPKDKLYATFQNYSLTDDLTPTFTVFFCRLRDIEQAYAMFKSLIEAC